MMSKALKGTLAAAAGFALSLSGVAAAQAQEEVGTLAAGDHIEDPGIRLHGAINDEPANPVATMRSLDLGGGDIRTVYCIQLGVPAVTDKTHEERPWEDIPVETLPKVLGVLVNGYNGSNAEDLLLAAEVDDEDLTGFTADQVAYAGTQSAIWSLTDGWAIDSGDNPDQTEGEDGVDAAVAGIQDYLLANSVPVDEPDFEPSIDIDRTGAKIDGTTVGPFTVVTNLDSVTFKQPEDATILDENGEEATTFTDGETFYVKFDEEKTDTTTLVTETATWTTPAGRTFVPVDDKGAPVTGQRLILAEAHPEEYTTEFTVDLTVEAVPSESASPPPTLVVTGSSLTTVASIGGAVLLAGIAAMVLMRRRAARANWGSDA